MAMLIPNRFLFDFEFVMSHRPELPAIDGGLADWTDADRLPSLGELDNRVEFADLWACWNEKGVSIACRVTGKQRRLECDPRSYWAGDNLRVCMDMRDARTVKRATRFCQQFYFLPTGGGPKKNKPVAGVAKIRRAREDAPAVPSERLGVASRVTDSGYSLVARIPAECLSGFDPVEHPRIGFYYILEDRDHGQQYLTVGDDLYWYTDPSTWATAVLAVPSAGESEVSPSRKSLSGYSVRSG